VFGTFFSDLHKAEIRLKEKKSLKRTINKKKHFIQERITVMFSATSVYLHLKCVYVLCLFVSNEAVQNWYSAQIGYLLNVNSEMIGII
jgi:hypothetical protein